MNVIDIEDRPMAQLLNREEFKNQVFSRDKHKCICCDFLGRTSTDREDKVIEVDFYKEISDRLNCTNLAFQFQNSLHKHKYLIKKTHHYLDTNIYDDTKSVVHILSGLPGAGKDTYINKHLSNLPVISLDSIRKELKIKPTDEQGLVFQTAKERAKEFLRKGAEFVWNGTNVSQMQRDSILSLVNDYNAYSKIVYIHSGLKKTLEQNKNRESAIPEKIILKLYRNLIIPKQIEAHEVKYIINE